MTADGGFRNRSGSSGSGFALRGVVLVVEADGHHLRRLCGGQQPRALARHGGGGIRRSGEEGIAGQQAQAVPVLAGPDGSPSAAMR
jgi:hypothetical protein